MMIDSKLPIIGSCVRPRLALRYPRATSSETPAEYVLEVLKNFLPLTADSRAELEVNIALIAESPALPQLVCIRNRAYEELGNACLRLTEKLACRPSDPELIERARHLHAVLDGLAIHLFMEPLANDSAWATVILEKELARIVGNC